MSIEGIQSGMVGMALFDLWMASVKKSHKAKKASKAGGGDALVAAAGEAFEQYIQSAELGIAGNIAGATSYALNPGGNSVQLLTVKDMAPFLALSVMA